MGWIRRLWRLKHVGRLSRQCWNIKKTTGNGHLYVPVFLLFTCKLPSWKLATFKRVLVLFVFLYLQQYKLRLIHRTCQQAIICYNVLSIFFAKNQNFKHPYHETPFKDLIHDYHTWSCATTVIYTQAPVCWNLLFEIRHAVKTLKPATQHKVNYNNFLKTRWHRTCAALLEYRNKQRLQTSVQFQLV